MVKCYGCFGNISEEWNACPHCGYLRQTTAYSKWILKPGTMLNGKYVIGKSLGEGGFGITYLAYDVNMETKVAIKEYFPTQTVTRDVDGINGNSVIETTSGPYESYEEGLRKYVKEAATLSKFFNLPGIVSVKDFFYENGTAYIVMEFIDGMSLKTYLQSNGGKLSYDVAIALVQPVISSLEVIHSNKLLHRDISPDNIMIQYDGKIKLIDFGAARSIENQAESGMTVMLKHGYAPIEQYSRTGAQGAYTDVYGICAVLYRMLTGAMPSEATDRVQKDNLIPIRKLIKGVPKHIARAIEKGLSVMPENRQQSMQELYDELYISDKGLTRQKLDSFYTFLKRTLLVIVFLLVLLTVLGLYYKINYDKFDNVRNAINALMGNEEEDEFTDDETINSDSSKSKATESPKAEKTKKADKTSKAEKTPEATEEPTTTPMPEATATPTPSDIEKINEVSNEAEYDEELSDAIEAVKYGILSGKSNRTVSEILERYSDTEGKWEGIRDNDGTVYVKYTGRKNGEEFALIFKITSKTVSATQISISFELAGALKNGEAIKDYKRFFNDIVDEAG